MVWRKWLLAVLVPLSFMGCAPLAPGTVPATFNTTVAHAYGVLAATRDTAAQLLNRKAITVADAQAVQKQADAIHTQLNLAVSLSGKGDMTTAEAQLRTALAALTALEAQLKAKEAK